MRRDNYRQRIGLRELAGMLRKVRWRGDDGFTACCPAHEDSEPSLSVNLKGGKTLFKCHAGCSFQAICGALNVDPRDLFEESRNGFTRNGEVPRGTNGNGARFSTSNEGPKQEPPNDKGQQIRYEIRNTAGDLLATHVRLDTPEGKRMWWEPSGIKTASLPLYGVGRLTDAQAGDAVVLCEGEKATDSLWERRIVAVGTVTGASGTPSDDTLKALMPFKVYLWPDNDKGGQEHMNRIAQRLIALGNKNLARVEWPDAPDKGDAADYEGDPSPLFDAAEEVVQDDPPLHPMGLGELYDLVDEWDRQPWVWEGILPRSSLSLIVGKAETGKSTLIYGLIYSIVKGIEFFGRHCEQGRVLYLAGDPISEIVAGKTFRALGLRPGDGVEVVAGALVGDPDGIVKLRAWVKRFRPTLVVGDTLAATVAIDVDKYGQSYQVQQPLTQIARQYGPNFLMAHHSQKSAIDSYGVIDAALGSVGVAAVASSRMATKMYRRQGQRFFTSDMINLRLGQPIEGEHLVIKNDNGTMELGEAWGKRAVSMDSDLILKVMQAQSDPISERTLWNEIFPKPKWMPFKAALRSLLEAGTVTVGPRKGKGGGKVYSLGSAPTSTNDYNERWNKGGGGVFGPSQ